MPIATDNGNSDYILGDDGSENGVLIGATGKQLQTDDVARVSGLYTELTVGTTPVEVKVGGTALANRKYVTLRPKDNSIYWGYNNSVTTTTGTRIFKDELIILPVGVPVWVIADAAGRKISIGELS